MNQKRCITVFFLTMINLATILSIRNWPLTAEYGLASVSYLILAMIFFFIPCAMVSAELATGWPKEGGVFVWVKEALGHRWGFLAVWLLWIENVVWYPTILSFIAASIAYIFNPSLATNPFYLFFMIIGIFWLVTLANLGGMRLSSWISTVGVIAGTIIPGTLIIFLGLIWLSAGHPTELHFSWAAILPDFSTPSRLTFLTAVLLSFFGIEMSAVHAKDVINPQKNYSKAIFYSAFLIIILSVLGTLALAIILPSDKISLVSGSVEALYKFLNQWGLSWMVPFVAGLMALGALAGVSTWTAGPCRGLLAAAEKGDFPPFFHKANKHNMPVNLMATQGVIVTILAILFIFMPSVSSSFLILTILSAQLYIIMYTLLFISGIVLRYKKPDLIRSYRIPGRGNSGMWIVSSLGLVGCIFAFTVGFFSPEQLSIGNTLFFKLFLSVGIVVCCSIPLIIYQMRTDRWLKSN